MTFAKRDERHFVVGVGMFCHIPPSTIVSSLLYASQMVLRARSDWWLVAPSAIPTASDTYLLKTKSDGLITPDFEKKRGMEEEE
jgi:hypothetical protein